MGLGEALGTWLLGALGEHLVGDAAAALVEQRDAIGSAFARAVAVWEQDHGGLIQPGALELAFMRGILPAPNRDRLLEVLSKSERLPTLSEWTDGLMEVWSGMRAGLGQGPMADIGQPLLQLSRDEALVLLQALAEEINREFERLPSFVIPILSKFLQGQEHIGSAIAEFLRRQQRTDVTSGELGRIVSIQQTIAQRTASNPYVHRAKVEKAVIRRLRPDRFTWVSIEGDAGTGKSTLLAHLHDQWLAEAIAGARTIPVFADAQGLLADLHESSLGFLVREAGLTAQSVWDGLSELAERLRAKEKRLLLVLDTVDAGLLRGGRFSGFATWLSQQTGHIDFDVVSACRPLEAGQFLPEDRQVIELGDFTEKEASEAVETYADKYHSHLAPAAREAARSALEGYLANDAIAALCRLPLTLRMIFEAYDIPPPILNRAKLFDDFWRRRVLGHGDVGRPLRATPQHRISLALDIAWAMAEARGDSLITGRVSAICGERADALEDLSSNRIVSCEEDRWRFFHQAFLEHTIARAVLRGAMDGDRTRLRHMLSALQDEGQDPMYAVIEEIAIQASYIAPEIATETIRALVDSQSESAPVSAGTVWCHMPVETDLEAVTALLATKPAARRMCMRTIHNATSDRVGEILSELAEPMWNSGAPADRLALLDGLQRATHLNPSAVCEALDDLGIEHAILHDKAISPSDQGWLATALIEVYAAFLGVDDEVATKRLQTLYRAFAARHDASLLANLVDVVAGRARVSTSVATILREWIARSDSLSLRSLRQLRDAFGRALGSLISRPDPESTRTEITEVQQATENGMRWLAVWRERVLAGAWSLDEAIWPVFTKTEDLAVLGGLHSRVILPLATLHLPELFERLTKLAMETNIGHVGRVRRKFSIIALSAFANDSSYAQEIGERLGPQLIRATDLTSIRCASRVCNWLPPDHLLQLLALAQTTFEATAAIAKFVSRDITPPIADLVVGHIRTLDAIGKSGELLRDVARLLPRCPTESWTRTLDWLETFSNRATKRNRGVRAMVDALTEICDSIDITSYFLRLMKRWESTKSVDQTAIGQEIVRLLSHWTPSPETCQILVQSVERIATDSRRNNVAFEILSEIGAKRAELIGPLIEPMIVALESMASDSITSATLISRAKTLHHTASSETLLAWNATRRIDAVAQRVALGSGGTRRLVAHLAGILRAALRNPSARAALISDLVGLSDALQYNIFQWAGKMRDLKFLDETKVLASQLGSRARTRRAEWERKRPTVSSEVEV